VTVTLVRPHEHLTLMASLSEQRAERLVNFLADSLHGAVVDIGCGLGELLLNIVAAAPAAGGPFSTHLPTSVHSRSRQRPLPGTGTLTPRLRGCNPDSSATVAT
jgi:hypothetical protein